MKKAYDGIVNNASRINEKKKKMARSESVMAAAKYISAAVWRHQHEKRNLCVAYGALYVAGVKQ